MTKNLMTMITLGFNALFVVGIIVLVLGTFWVSLNTGADTNIVQTMIVFGLFGVGYLISGIYSLIMIYSEDEES